MRFAALVIAASLGLLGPYHVTFAQTCAQAGAVDQVVRRGDGHLHLNLLLKDVPANNWKARLRVLLKEQAPEFTYVDKLPATGFLPKNPWLYADLITDASQLPRPSASFLEFKGRTLTAAERELAQRPNAVLLLGFGIPKEAFTRQFLQANGVAASVAESLGALLVDDDTRDIFSPQSWRSSRVRNSSSEIVVSHHLAVHLYRNGEHLRAVTLGMAKFGLPELAVHELAASENRPVGDLINLVAQRLYEREARVAKGRFDLSLKDLDQAPWLQEVRAGFGPKASGAGPLCFFHAKPEPGDADNQLVRIGFDLSSGPDRHAKRHAFLTAFFGVEGSDVLGARGGDAELLAASQRARRLIPKLKADFQKGLAPGERLMVKSAFKAGEQTEFMWLEVSRWVGAQISGLLMSEPRYVTNLRSGQQLNVRESDFYDYLRVLPDGKTEGNETGKILEARAGRR